MIEVQTQIDHELDSLELSGYARELPSVVNKARTLVRDRQAHAMVGERLVEKGQLSCAEAMLAETSFLQFALLCAVTDQTVTPSGLADEYWHDFILHTHQYAEWCQRHFGRFLHHRPASRESLEERGVVQNSLRLYDIYFNSKTAAMAKCNGHDCHGTCTVHRSEKSDFTCDAA